MPIDLQAIRSLETKRWKLYSEELTPLVQGTYNPSRPALTEKATEARIRKLWVELSAINDEIWRIRGGENA